MQHERRITVLETKVFPELQEKYLADPKSGPCRYSRYIRSERSSGCAVRRNEDTKSEKDFDLAAYSCSHHVHGVHGAGKQLRTRTVI